MSARMIPFAGLGSTGWTPIAVKSRTEHGAVWHEMRNAPIPLHDAMDEAAAGRWIVAQRHEDGVSYLVCRPAGRRG